MRRLATFVSLIFLLALAALLAATADPSPNTAGARASSASALPISFAPAVDCTLTPISFSLAGSGAVGASRPFSVTVGDTFAQFVAPPITATTTSQGFVTVNDNFTGNVSGGITGTFVISNLNGLLVTNPEGPVTTPRGMQLNEIVIRGATGTITAVMAVDFAGLIPGAPYPRTFNAYLHSIATSGAYAPYRFVGALTFGTMNNVAGVLSINGNVFGTLYIGADSINQSLLAVRDTPTDRPTSFQATDIIAQVRRPDLLVGTTAPARINPLDNFVGTTTISNTGGFVLSHNGLVLDAGTNSGRGWIAGGFNFADANGDIIIAPWISDISGTNFNTSVSGYFFKAVGTGVYTDSIFFASVNGTILNRTGFGGTMTGVFCAGSRLATPTVTITPQVTSTSTGAASSTPTRTSVATASTTLTSIATSTPTSASTSTSTVMATSTSTSTSVAPTATASATPTTIPTSTSTSTSLPASTATSPPSSTPAVTATPTACPLTFTDVPSTHTFYPSVHCLACRGIISGYADGTFRPDNLVTRGQLAKIVSNAANFTEPPGTQIFQDVAPDHTFYEWINRLTRRGHMTGYECGSPGEPCVNNRPYFRPFNNATRAQTSKIVANAARYNDPPTGQTFEDVPPTHPFYTEIQRLASRNIMGGYQCGGPGEPCIPPLNRAYFRPYNDVTRGQSAKIVANTFYPNCPTP